MFGNRLKSARISRGLSQAELGLQINAPPQQVQRWEKNTAAPNGETVITLAKALNVSADYLLGLVEGYHDIVQDEELTPEERRVLDAMRRGDKVDAIKVIVGG